MINTRQTLCRERESFFSFVLVFVIWCSEVFKRDIYIGPGKPILCCITAQRSAAEAGMTTIAFQRQLAHQCVARDAQCDSHSPDTLQGVGDFVFSLKFRCGTFIHES